jgi:hypothetical protein
MMIRMGVNSRSKSKYSVKWDTNEKIDSDLTKDKNQDTIDRGS